MSYIGLSSPDNQTLFSGTITATGAGNALDMTGYDSALIQVNGSTFSGIITLERSLDKVVWYPCLVTEMNAMNQKSQIDSLGLYAVRTEAQYLRYNVTNISGSVTLMIDGGQSAVSNVDKVAWAMDETNNSPLNIKFQTQNSGVKQDLSGAFILSDAPAPVLVTTGVTNANNIIDTTGYQTIHLTTGATFASTSGVQFSNDGITFGTGSPSTTSLGVFANTLGASTSYTIPVQGRYARIVATTAGSYTYVLRNIQPQITGQNLVAINGAAVAPTTTAQLGINLVNIGNTGVIAGGPAGTLGVGGTNAVGATSTSNPVLIGGVDPTGLARRATTTMLGDVITGNRTIPSSSAALSSANTGNTPIGATGYNNQVPQTIQDTSQYEGQTQVELLAQILQEMKIMNQQLYELPRIIAGQLNGLNTPGYLPMFTMGDEPTQMRNDVTLFDKQQ